jgi:hypothetical protein
LDPQEKISIWIQKVNKKVSKNKKYIKKKNKKKKKREGDSNFSAFDFTQTQNKI